MATEQPAAAELPVSAAELIATKRLRIAHLSDLHFGSTFDAELWGYVQGVLAEHNPELLVITGDVVDTPSLFQMGLVLQELQRTAEKLKCKFLLIPGNHDVAIMGNVAIWPWHGKYRIVFSRLYDRYFSGLRTFSEFKALPLINQITYRTWWWLKLTLLRLTLQLRDPGEAAFRVTNATAASGRVVFACFNSNAKLWLATGRVDHEAIQSLDRELESLSRDGKAGWLAPRVALVHHHAVAIPYSTTTESLTAFEPFLTMRNAGTLLHELGKLEFDLLLHGHKHFWNFARLSFDSPGRRSSEMAIISAGSATVKQTRAGSNSLNLIDVMPNGMIVHRPLFFGQGMTIAGGYTETPESARALLTLEQVKQRAYRKAVKHLQCECDLLEREIRIDSGGAGDFTLRVRGYRALGGRRTRRAQLHVTVGTGGINPRSVTLDDRVDARGHYLDINPSALPTKHLVVPVDLGSEVYEGREDSVDFGVQCRTLNSFAITKWEASVLPGPGMDEWAGVTIRQPTRKLRLVVDVPNVLKEPGREPVLVCQRPVNYPALSFNADGEVDLPSREEEWVTDQDFTNLEKSRLNIYEVYSDTGDSIGSNRRPGTQVPHHNNTRCELVIDQPLVGCRYLVRWQVRTSFTECPSGTKGDAMQLRQALLRMQGNPSCPPYLANIRTTLQEVLDELFHDVFQPTFRSRFMRDEGLVAAVFVYNDKKNVLDLLLEAGPGQALSGRCESIPLNEGVVGSVFKKRMPALFMLPDLARAKHDGLYVYYEPARTPKPGDEFAALAAIPLYLGRYEVPGANLADPTSPVPPEAMIGVLTLGSNAQDSGLLRLTTEEGKDDGEMLRSIGEHFVKGLVSQLENTGLEE